ncbi:MAG: hypothetical protein V8R40_04015 [Dysosmobacter sp.]
MNTLEILRFLHRDPLSCLCHRGCPGYSSDLVIDLMLADETGLFFWTARGNPSMTV